MSRRLETLATVKQVAVANERREAQRLADCLQRHADRSGKLDALSRYFSEYSLALDTKARHGVTVAEMQQQRAFLFQLDQAVGQQHTSVDATQRQLDEQRARWLAAKRKVDAVEELIARQHKEDMARAAKREQGMQDDLAGQQWYRRR